MCLLAWPFDCGCPGTGSMSVCDHERDTLMLLTNLISHWPCIAGAQGQPDRRHWSGHLSSCSCACSPGCITCGLGTDPRRFCEHRAGGITEGCKNSAEGFVQIPSRLAVEQCSARYGLRNLALFWWVLAEEYLLALISLTIAELFRMIRSYFESCLLFGIL